MMVSTPRAQVAQPLNRVKWAITADPDTKFDLDVSDNVDVPLRYRSLPEGFLRRTTISPWRPPPGKSGPPVTGARAQG